MLKKIALCALMLVMCFSICIGYAALTDSLTIVGTATITPPPLPDLRIIDITPDSSAGVTVTNTNGTVLFASVDGGGKATFTIRIINNSGGIYVFDRVIDGDETNFDGVYSGTDITYELSGLSRLDEIAADGGIITFDITIDVPEGVTTEHYILNFNFVSKYGIPDNEYFPDDMPDEEVSVVQRLSDILNNIYTSDKTGNMDSRTYLLEETIQDRWAPGADPYVGTMSIEHIEQLKNLFGDILNDSSVSFILKNQDLTGDGYNEITLYSTSDPLTNQTENLRGVVCVYATVFTPVIDENNNIIGYNMLCEAMRGYCYEVNYGSGNTNASFSTDEWKNDVGYALDWVEGIGAILAEIPDDAIGFNQYWDPFDKHDYYSYNAWYVDGTNYWWYNTAPYGKTLAQCLTEKTQILPDVYITDVSLVSGSGATVKDTNGTALLTSVTGNDTTFTVDVINISNKTYIFDRVIDGNEATSYTVYTSTGIDCTLSGISRLDEISANGGTLSFNVTINVQSNVTADDYILIFNFIEKTDTGILPGNDEYDITLQYNNNQPNETLRVHANDFIPRPETPYKDGYTFTGWYTDAICTSTWNFDIDRAKNAMTLYAGWEKNAPTEYMVTFCPNNGEYNYIAFVSANTLIPLQQVPVKEGYTFIGWYTDSACTTPWNFDTDKITSNITLYGGWEIYVPPVPPDCDITFKPNNGEADTTIVVLTGEFIPRPTPPVRPGYSFVGWYIDDDCTNAWNFEVNKVENHTVLYGGWEYSEYTITFKPNNGTQDTTVTVLKDTLIPAPQPPTKTGYIFIGWYTDEQCKNGWNFDTDFPASDMILYGGWEKATNPSNEAHGDFFGLVEALLSNSNSCLNNSDVILDAVLESLTSKKRPKEDAPIVHCSVNSVSGGTMSSIASFANSKLTSKLQFLFEADPDPAYQNTRMRLYMYYQSDIEDAKIGDEIMVYQQIVTRGADGVWYADGTYAGVATVGIYFGGGNAGKDVKTISPYTWRTTSTTEE